ncbi:glycerophosphodiester phosphodiesterase [Kineococcus gynurae]|uniref:Glycerophosphodiester phosphodiesterase n=1 Tax=Kineococcus gynurae TaxID=452979 RepID=A0ABV5LSB5_9ACTN
MIAHRGASTSAPENTLAAFAAAVAVGADLLELDVRQTADGVPVVLHDATLDRTTDGRGPVARRPWRDVARLDAGAWFAPGFAGERVPTVAQVADLVRVGGPGLLLELKGRWDPRPLAGLIRLLRPGGLARRCVVQSFDREVLATLRREAPDVGRALLVVRPSRGLLRSREAARIQAERARVQFGVLACNPHVGRGLTAATVAGYHDAGVRTFPWTVEDPRHWAELVAAGVDGIITDSPGRLRAFLDGGGPVPSPRTPVDVAPAGGSPGLPLR